ncbi:hypothetical protein [Solirubrobacter soli]|uniref:hypothetical protein n=1 Tax=Solirubrobacter soli TaxID=363832 RepID=UPI000486B37C|nr:hypothetical protein [Solirubrobacter soli]
MRLFVCVLLLALLACVAPRVARASCVGAVVVDGTVLLGESASDRTLPRTAGEMPAVSPACNDGGPKQPDGRTTVVRFAGVPADIAVRSVDGEHVYIAYGSLTALATHPLHQPSSPRFSRRRCATRKPTLEGAADSAGYNTIDLIAGGRSHLVRVDARTALVNRPVYQPIRRGQRLSITATRCGSRLIADRIAFTGPTIAGPRYQGYTPSALGSGLPWPVVLLIAALALALAVWLVERITRPRPAR